MKYILRKLLFILFELLIPLRKRYEFYVQEKARVLLYSKFKSVGENCYFPELFIVKNPQYISIGKKFSAMHNLRLEAWDEYCGKKYNPQIILGDNICCNSDVHIGCIDKVIIGDNVLFASRIYISDHSHGEITSDALKYPPVYRPLFSKGPVIIESNVWIGEGVCILPGVTIGENSIIGSNAVVTRSVPRNSIVAGVPGKVIKTL